MPPNTVYAGRPTRWGNPFHWEYMLITNKSEARRATLKMFRAWLSGHYLAGSKLAYRRYEVLDNLHNIRGKDLACWCPLDQACHADVLLELANG